MSGLVAGLVAFGTITAALIAGLFSFLNLVLSKEAKVSEFRHEWSNALREDLGIFCGCVAVMAGKPERDAYDAAHRDAAAAYNRIALRLHPGSSKAQLSLLAAVSDVADEFDGGDPQAALGRTPAVREAGLEVLAEEWERVRTGEPMFVRTKRTAKGALIGGLAAALLWLAAGGWLLTYQARLQEAEREARRAADLANLESMEEADAKAGAASEGHGGSAGEAERVEPDGAELEEPE